MSDWDQMVERMCEQDGVRMASGHHIATPAAPHTRHRTTCNQVKMADRLECVNPLGHAGPHDWQAWDTLPEEDPWVDRRDDNR